MTDEEIEHLEHLLEYIEWQKGIVGAASVTMERLAKKLWKHNPNHPILSKKWEYTDLPYYKDQIDET